MTQEALKTTGKNKRKREEEEEEEEDRDATHATTTRRRRIHRWDYVPNDSSKTLRFRERELITTLPVTTRQNSTSRIKLSRTTATQARRRIPIRPTRTTLNATSFSKSQKEVVHLLLDSELEPHPEDEKEVEARRKAKEEKEKLEAAKAAMR